MVASSAGEVIIKSISEIWFVQFVDRISGNDDVKYKKTGLLWSLHKAFYFLYLKC